MKYVLDANVAWKWVLRERDSDQSRQLLFDYQQHVHDLLAPNSFPIEVAHALSRSERRNPMSIDVEKPLSQEEADSQEVARLVAEGKRVTDPELRRRVTERAEKVRQAIFEKHGVVEWAVEMIRDARDE